MRLIHPMGGVHLAALMTLVGCGDPGGLRADGALEERPSLSRDSDTDTDVDTDAPDGEPACQPEWEYRGAGGGGIVTSVYYDDDSGIVGYGLDVGGFVAGERSTTWPSAGTWVFNNENHTSMPAAEILDMITTPDWSGDYWYVATPQGIFRDTLGGDGWEDFNQGIVGRAPAATDDFDYARRAVSALERVPVEEGTSVLFAGMGRTPNLGVRYDRKNGNDDKVYRRKATDTEWEPVCNFGTDSTAQVFDIVANPDDGDQVWVATTHGLWRITGALGESPACAEVGTDSETGLPPYLGPLFDAHALVVDLDFANGDLYAVTKDGTPCSGEQYQGRGSTQYNGGVWVARAPGASTVTFDPVWPSIVQACYWDAAQIAVDPDASNDHMFLLLTGGTNLAALQEYEPPGSSPGTRFEHIYPCGGTYDCIENGGSPRGVMAGNFGMGSGGRMDTGPWSDGKADLYIAFPGGLVGHPRVSGDPCPGGWGGYCFESTSGERISATNDPGRPLWQGSGNDHTQPAALAVSDTSSDPQILTGDADLGLQLYDPLLGGWQNLALSDNDSVGLDQYFDTDSDLQRGVLGLDNVSVIDMDRESGGYVYAAESLDGLDYYSILRNITPGDMSEWCMVSAHSYQSYDPTPAPPGMPDDGIDATFLSCDGESVVPEVGTGVGIAPMARPMSMAIDYSEDGPDRRLLYGGNGSRIWRSDATQSSWEKLSCAWNGHYLGDDTIVNNIVTTPELPEWAFFTTYLPGITGTTGASGAGGFIDGVYAIYLEEGDQQCYRLDGNSELPTESAGWNYVPSPTALAIDVSDIGVVTILVGAVQNSGLFTTGTPAIYQASFTPGTIDPTMYTMTEFTEVVSGTSTVQPSTPTYPSGVDYPQRVESIRFGANGEVFAAIGGAGGGRYDDEAPKFMWFSDDGGLTFNEDTAFMQGLPSYHVADLVPSGDGYWALTDNGVWYGSCE